MKNYEPNMATFHAHQTFLGIQKGIQKGSTNQTPPERKHISITCSTDGMYLVGFKKKGIHYWL